jgi:hypothetical protein
MTLDLVVSGMLIAIAGLLGYFGAVLFTNGARRRGLIAGASALVLAVSTYLVLWPALVAAQSGEGERLRAELAAVARVRDDIAADNTALKASDERQRQHIASLNRVQLERLSALQTEVDRVTGNLADPRSGLVLDAPVRAALPASATGTATHFDRVASAIRDLGGIRPRETQSAARSVDQTRELMQLRDRMGARLSTPGYDVEVYPDKELVGGRVGKYYVVDLKDAANGIRYYFDGGRYTLARGNAEFRSSLNSFIGDVLGKMQGNVRYDLFVRGSADRKPYEGRFEPGHEITQIKYLRSLGNDKYAKEHAELRLADGIVRNKDLPNLRAAFLKNLIGEIYPVKPPEILEGTVTPVESGKDRNAELILFVEW